ncbi:MAG: cation:proton antiporter subunit C [Rickettsiaceae bacterium]
MYFIVYFCALLIFLSGLYIMLTSDNYIRKIIGLGTLQGSVLVFYTALGKVEDGIAPFYQQVDRIYSSPLPQVLMLTAIVVGFATLSVGLALIYRIYHQYNSISEATINAKIHNNNNEDL